MQTHLTFNRVVGVFPLSIATSIALEHVFGIKSEANPEPKPNRIQQYGAFWINLKTLFRNLLGSLEKESAKSVLPNELADSIYEEMELMIRLIQEFSLGMTKPVFYLNNLNGIENRYKLAQFRTDQTDNQKAYSALMKTTIEQLLKKGHPEGAEIKTFNLILKPSEKVKTLILTHQTYDLVSHNHFSSLSLIESHTGAIKDKELWYTKYSNGKELNNIPFMEGLLPLFGDSETFKPLNKQARDDILQIATKYHWTPVSTRDKVLYGVDKLTNPYLKEAIRSFFH